MGVMAAGENPLTAWDGSAFNDYIRASPSVAGTPLLYIACLCAIKGDWQEFCSSFAFANWATIESPCFSCWANKHNYLTDQALKFRESVWPDFTMEDYLLACESCEVSVTVASLAVLRQIRAALFYDKRPKGARGRALRWDVPSAKPPLQHGDRWEPTRMMPDVAIIDKLGEDDLPVYLVFWMAVQVRVKHRNPFFNPSLGITPYLVVPDQLHAFNFGCCSGSPKS